MLLLENIIYLLSINLFAPLVKLWLNSIKLNNLHTQLLCLNSYILLHLRNTQMIELMNWWIN